MTKSGKPIARAESRMPATAPGLLTNHAAKVFNRRMDGLLRPLGISLAHLTPLMMLRRHGPMAQRDLVSASGVAQPAMVHILARLEVAGLATRAPSLRDRRSSIFSLTSAGERAVEDASPLLVGANDEALAGFTAEESRTLAQLLARLIANLEAP